MLGLLGEVLILIMNLPAWLTVCGSLGWAGWTLLEAWQLWRSQCRYRRLRLTVDGGLQVLDASGDWHPAELRPGSVLLRRLGWLRVRVAGRETFGELLRGDCDTDRDWRRAQVLWRHVGAAS